ncbi:MAG: carbohydrate-binding domain-containing protein [Eubacteriales bacterium]|nr:carbohydrate-binding domain-containing protein [Eubacteriales bacterium]
MKKMMRGLCGALAAALCVVSAGCAKSAPPQATASETLSPTAGATSQLQGDAALQNASPLAQVTVDYSELDLAGTWEENTAVGVALRGAEVQITGEGAIWQDGVLSITAEGVYVLSGQLTGRIVVDAPENAKVQLVLNGVSVTASDGPAIYIRQADKVFLTLAQGTQNSLTDAATYAQTLIDEGVNAAVMSKEDLTVNGTGSLSVTGNYRHGISSNDDLIVVDAAVAVLSQGDGIKGKDLAAFKNAVLTLDAQGDGIQSSNAEDAEKGNVVVDGGSIFITAQLDGIQANTVLQINDGELNISTGGGSANASTKSGWGNWGDWGADNAQEEDTASAKGLKAGGMLIVNGGTLSLLSGDDGIHADSCAAIQGGSITISQSYEGIEGNTIDISGGEVHVTSSDDGLNAAGGSDSSSLGGRPGQNAFANDESAWIHISGGYLVVDALGDGIDSNGSLEVSGGVTLVSGPTDSGNGALDYNGSAAITGGVLVAAGSTGMAQNFDSSSTQASWLATLSAQQGGGTALTLLDSKGNAILTCTPAKNYACVVVSCPDMAVGSAYTLSVGSVSGLNADGFAQAPAVSGLTQVASATLSSVVTGEGGGFGGGGSRPGGGKGGFGGR